MSHDLETNDPRSIVSLCYICYMYHHPIWNTISPYDNIFSIHIHPDPFPNQADRCVRTGLRCDPRRRFGGLLGSGRVWRRQPDGPTAPGGCDARTIQAVPWGWLKDDYGNPGNQAVAPEFLKEAIISVIVDDEISIHHQCSPTFCMIRKGVEATVS